MSANKKFDEYLTVSQAAQFLGVTTTTLRNWDKSGKLSAYRHPLNRYRLYLKLELEELLRGIKNDEDFRKKETN